MINLILEILHSAHYDITQGNPVDAVEALEEVIKLLENQEATA